MMHGRKNIKLLEIYVAVKLHTQYQRSIDSELLQVSPYSYVILYNHVTIQCK